jgi:N-acetylglucosamine malate deacetylase 2
MPGESVSTLIVAPHPDDEVLGAGIWMHRHRGERRHVLHLTDGSPRDMENAAALGFSSAASYGLARRAELMSALQMIGVRPGDCTQLACPDKEAYLNLAHIVTQIELLVEQLRPERILSPAYEGGHPDHDAAAFAVAMVRQRIGGFEHWEFPLYHAGEQAEMITGRFIGSASTGDEEVIAFSSSERNLKSRMLNCFETQREILSCFSCTEERFRRAPAYDFTKPPHPGVLLYESWNWGISGTSWRQHAAKELNETRTGLGKR